MRRRQIDLDVGYGLGVPKQPQAEHSARKTIEAVFL
jgi:hypothetical protein